MTMDKAFATCYLGLKPMLEERGRKWQKTISHEDSPMLGCRLPA